ncbi:MAG: hypothetical protein LBQ54_05305 [Planctomycetaceae bacterium]|nr:hypothetical protein [Planctomycetaceae bacterium]
MIFASANARALDPEWSYRSESHGPAPVSRWEACRFTAGRPQAVRKSFQLEAEGNRPPGLPGCDPTCHVGAGRVS